MVKKKPKKGIRSLPGGDTTQATEESLTLREYLEVLAEEELDESSEPEETPELWVSFVLGEELFGLKVEQVREVLRVGTITRVPRSPASLRGVTNMRGRVLAVVDLRVRLGMEATEAGEGNRILVTDGPSGPVGLLVDRVQQMERILPSEVQESPDRRAALTALGRGVVPREEGVLVLLELDALMRPEAGASEP